MKRAAAKKETKDGEYWKCEVYNPRGAIYMHDNTYTHMDSLRIIMLMN